MNSNYSILIALLIMLSPSLEAQNYEWKQETVNFTRVDSITYYFPAHVSLEDRNKSIALCQQVIAENLEFIQEKEYTKAIDVTYLNTRKEMLRYTGYTSQGIAYFFRNAVFSLINQYQPIIIKHEMMHMISADLWGVPANSSIWMYEGLATYAAGYCSEHSLEEIYQYLLQSKKRLTLSTLSGDFRSLDEVTSYTESAFLVKYLLDHYGFDKVKQLWLEGLDKFESIYGFSVEQFEAQLEQEFKLKYPKPIEFNVEAYETGCE